MRRGRNVNDDLKARADKAIEAFTAVIVERADRQDVSAVKKTGERVLQEAKAVLPRKRSPRRPRKKGHPLQSPAHLPPAAEAA